MTAHNPMKILRHDQYPQNDDLAGFTLTKPQTLHSLLSSEEAINESVDAFGEWMGETEMDEDTWREARQLALEVRTLSADPDGWLSVLRLVKFVNDYYRENSKEVRHAA